MAKLTINGTKVKVKNGSTILQAATLSGIEIPTLCFIEEINEIGFCRICVVEVEGEQDLVSACNTEVTNGMTVYTDSDKVQASRKATLSLLASRHRFDCWRCPKDGMCEFYDLLKHHNVVFDEFGPGVARKDDLIVGTAISQDQSKCVLCKRCVAVCQNVVTANVLKFHDDDGMNPVVSPAIGLSFDETGCVHCGQCIKACPTGTLFETDHTDRVLSYLKDKDGQTIVQLDKQAASAVAEQLGYDINTPLEETQGKTYKALELLGFDTVTNTDLGTDLQAIEMANEFLNRLENGGPLPLITSTCPATISFFEQHAQDHLEQLSTVKSPHILSGSLFKHEWLKQPTAKVVTVATCTAKKYEISREELSTNKIPDVDAVLTVRELVKLIKLKGLNFKKLQPSTPDNPFTGPNATYQGGTLISVLNVVSQSLNNTPLEDLDFKTIRGGLESNGTIEETVIPMGTTKLRVARVYGGAAFKEMFERMNNKQYHVIQFMMCPGGCLSGGGMPVVKNLPTHDVIRRRNEAYCNSDAPLSNPLHNGQVQSLPIDTYEAYFHTTYTPKEFRKE